VTNVISPHQDRRTYALRDGTLSALHFGDVSEPARLVFLHANGFNAQSYTQILGALGVHAVAFDMRGHGESRNMPQPAISGWQIFREDCVEFFDRHLPDLTDGPVVLAGHSFGAVTGILAAPKLVGRIKGYVGFDPVSVPTAFRLTSVLPGGKAYMKKRVPIARNAGRRKSVFDSPEAAFARWQGRGAFRGMPDSGLRDYIAGGLVEGASGQWELACDPRWEQQIFVAQWHNLFRAARSLPDNSTVIYAGGRPPVSTKGTRAAVQKAQPKADVRFDQALGHLFPLVQPDMAITLLRQALA
jgi:pimeloyl-ACP methyl ester carboxylesterase